MKKTIAQNEIEKAEKMGYKLHGKTSGTPTTRRGSNLCSYLERNNLLDAYLTDEKSANEGLLSGTIYLPRIKTPILANTLQGKTGVSNPLTIT